MSLLVFILQVKGEVDLNPPGEFRPYSTEHQAKGFSYVFILNTPVLSSQQEGNWRKGI